MRHLKIFSAALALVAAACTSQPKDQRSYALQGQIVSIDPDRQQAMIKHGDIPGLMPAMTMSYKMKDAGLLNGVNAGDTIDATLVIVPNNAFITKVKKTGEAPLDQPPAEAPAPIVTGVPLLK